jgi:hypothetical protein
MLCMIAQEEDIGLLHCISPTLELISSEETLSRVLNSHTWKVLRVKSALVQMGSSQRSFALIAILNVPLSFQTFKRAQKQQAQRRRIES